MSHRRDSGVPVPSASSAYKLYYFDLRARGELLRLIFHAAGQDYEDIRVSASSWNSLKSATPLQTLPVLEVDGHQLAQTMSIARFLATEFGLRGKSRYEQALIDSVAETADDLLSDYLSIIFVHQSAKKHELRKQFTEKTLPAILAQLDEFQKSYSKEYGYVIGNGLTYADLAVYSVIDQLLGAAIVDQNVLQRYKYPTELRKRILTHGGITRYLNNRPRSMV